MLQLLETKSKNLWKIKKTLQRLNDSTVATFFCIYEINILQIVLIMTYAKLITKIQITTFHSFQPPQLIFRCSVAFIYPKTMIHNAPASSANCPINFTKYTA